MPVRRELMRALVTLMKGLAAAYGISIPATAVRTATEAQIKKSYAALVKKVHPDKGGTKDEFQRLHAAYESWKREPQQGRPSNEPDHDDAGDNGACAYGGFWGTCGRPGAPFL